MNTSIRTVALAAALGLGAPIASHAAPRTQCALPDLAAAVPQTLQLQDVFNANEGKKGDGKAVHTEFLRFSNNIANIGAGPLEVLPLGSSTTGFNDAVQNVYAAENVAAVAGDGYICDDPFGTCATYSLSQAFFFHPEHNHYHMNDVADFGVHKALDTGFGGSYEAATVGNVIKQTFCLIDYVPMEGTKPGSRTYYDCLGTDQCWRTQGITSGWMDEYHQSTDFQGMEVTDAPDGTYYLVTTSNPKGVFAESDYDNNSAWASFELYRDSNGNRKIGLLWHSACETAQWGMSLCGKDWGGFTTNR
jgi:hypothetical protein